MRVVAVAATAVLIAAGAAHAGPANVVAVRVTPEPGGTWCFWVTVRHDDEGWEHYADRFEILAPGGKVLDTRILMHPHVSEQPFTRQLTGVHLPAGIGTVTVRAHDKVHGYGGGTVSIAVPPGARPPGR